MASGGERFDWPAAGHRFFVSPDDATPNRVRFSSDQSHQMARVLRLRPDAAVIALDGLGHEYLVRLEEVSPTSAWGVVLAARDAPGEPRARLTLHQSLLPRDKFELVLQKGTEVGVSAFVPVLTERGLVREPLKPARIERWRNIAREAAEQSRRGRVPEVHQAAPLPDTLRSLDASVARLFAWERATLPLGRVLRECIPPGVSAHLWVGPEGGFTHAEARLAEAAGCHLVSLGPRILRTETAGPVLAALVLYAAGELG